MTLMKPTTKLAVAVALIALACVWWFAGRESKRVLASHETPATNPTVIPAIVTETNRQPQQNIFTAASALASAQTAAERNPALAQLRQALVNGSTDEKVAAIRKLLDSKTDAATGLSFKPGKNGSLAEAPTLRTFLLDELARLDPAAAATVAREILNTSTSPDEWAVALRNLARGDTGADARMLLASKMGELLRNQAWQRDTAAGYLEAFDTAVFLGGTELLSPLADLLRQKDNPALAHAAFLALDRLAFNEPAQVLAALEKNPEWLQGREETRADYFARADVSNAAQRGIVENYLLDAVRSPAELQAFAGVFPNANFMVSQNLLTESKTLDHATIVSRDAASLKVVNAWLADARFEKIRPQLIKLQTRLEQFVNPEK